MSVQTVFANGVNPWAMYFKQPTKKLKRQCEFVDLEIADDPILLTKNAAKRRRMNVKAYEKPSKYAHNFDKMKPGQCVKCPDGVWARSVSDAMCKWIVTKGRTDLFVKATENYNGTGIGRVWLVKA